MIFFFGHLILNFRLKIEESLSEDDVPLSVNSIATERDFVYSDKLEDNSLFNNASKCLLFATFAEIFQNIALNFNNITEYLCICV